MVIGVIGDAAIFVGLGGELAVGVVGVTVAVAEGIGVARLAAVMVVGIAGRIAIGICNARRAAVESYRLPTPVRYGSVVVHARCALQANLIAMGAMGFSLLGIFQFFCTHIISRADPPTIFRLD